MWITGTTLLVTLTMDPLDFLLWKRTLRRQCRKHRIRIRRCWKMAKNAGIIRVKFSHLKEAERKMPFFWSWQVLLLTHHNCGGNILRYDNWLSSLSVTYKNTFSCGMMGHSHADRFQLVSVRITEQKRQELSLLGSKLLQTKEIWQSWGPKAVRRQRSKAVQGGWVPRRHWGDHDTALTAFGRCASAAWSETLVLDHFKHCECREKSNSSDWNLTDLSSR